MNKFSMMAAPVAALVLLAGCASRAEVAAPISISQSSAETAENEIKSLLTRQAEAWNAGDIDGFMQDYWHSPELRFASGGTVTRGWQETTDRYHARYDTADAMGTLSFSALEVDVLSPDAATVHGLWLLTRKADAPSGLFTLVLRRMDGRWQIVSDTTTSAG